MLPTQLTLSAFISGLIDYMYIFVFCLLGAIVKDTYNTITDKDTKVKISRICISTLVSSIVLFSTSDYIASKLTWKLFILPCFIGGGLGFEMFGKINKLSFWLKILTRDKGNIAKTLSEEIVKEERIEEAKNKDPTDGKTENTH